jgi:type II secretory pathway component PulM
MTKLWTRAWTAFQSLSARERLLIGSAAGLILFALLWLGVVLPLVAAGGRVATRADAAEQQLAAITRLRREFDDVAGRLAAVEQRIRSESRGNLRTTLESLASAASVKVESMEPQTTPANDRFRETKVEVGLAGVTLPQTVSYLHQIDSAPQVLSVKSLRVRTRPDKPELLDVSFTVSSFEPL